MQEGMGMNAEEGAKHCAQGAGKEKKESNKLMKLKREKTSYRIVKGTGEDGPVNMRTKKSCCLWLADHWKT